MQKTKQQALQHIELVCHVRAHVALVNDALYSIHITAISQSKQESPADARVTRDSAIIPRWPPATILDFIEPQIAPFDPLTPKTLT